MFFMAFVFAAGMAALGHMCMVTDGWPKERMRKHHINWGIALAALLVLSVVEVCFFW